MYNHHRTNSRGSGANPAWRTGAGGSSSSGASGRSADSPQGALYAIADWAARNLEVDLVSTPTQTFVDRCCDPSLHEPNLAVELEFADYVNSKKANVPREAAMETVRRINSRNPNIAMLGLHLLDILVKNCGYPFHLQIATKEFLNELVKRFPERPPPFPSPTMRRILELIHEWKLTICVTSKHKEDLVHIRDMHRLLTYKGYRFPNIDSRVQSVLNPENDIKSAEELEEEDRAAQGAKLQELIRRGTPRDLEQAQELMKIMSGAEPENKPDYWAQAQKDLDKVQSRAILLNDMLNNVNEGEKFVQGDAYDQIANQLRSVQPRIQKWVSEAEEAESTHLDRLLLINDLINKVCERYESFKKGDFTATAEIDPSIDPSKGGANAVPTAKLTDLIDFADESGPTTSSQSQQQPAPSAAISGSILDDFASLSFSEPAPSAGASGIGSASGAGSGFLHGAVALPTSRNPTPAPGSSAAASSSKPASTPASAPASSSSTGLEDLDFGFGSSSTAAPTGAATTSSNGWTAIQPTQLGGGGAQQQGGSGNAAARAMNGLVTEQSKASGGAGKGKDPFGDLDALFK
ncbi:ARF-binding protein [Tilletia horrida]|uniref:ARF-binding protein n=1 Tax=Tilletia horrida TaxID=155126 RepID=A0AAN6GER9_9BASI|nr:ARF-binding protein [Tilletia horrida]